MRNERRLRHLVTFSIGLLLSGCEALTGISNDYPRSWPVLTQAPQSGCADISGTYVTTGVCNYPAFCESVSLLERLQPAHVGSDTPSVVAITQPSEHELNISFPADGDMSSVGLSNEAEQFSCNDGAVWIKQGDDAHAEGFGYASRHYILGLRKGSDGSLIGQHRNSGWGLAMWVVPIGGTQVLWYQWAPSTGNQLQR